MPCVSEGGEEHGGRGWGCNREGRNERAGREDTKAAGAHNCLTHTNHGAHGVGDKKDACGGAL